MSDDREAPTPRVTATWKVHEESAAQLSERLRARATSIGIDTLTSRRWRDLSDVCLGYARAFARWSTEEIPVAQKMRERQAFSHLVQAVTVELE